MREIGPEEVQRFVSLREAQRENPKEPLRYDTDALEVGACMGLCRP
jgi:hypothetical protein